MRSIIVAAIGGLMLGGCAVPHQTPIYTGVNHIVESGYTGMPVVVDAATAKREAAAKAEADRVAAAAKVAADHLAMIRAKRDAGKKLSAADTTLIAQADAKDAMEQAAQAQARLAEAEYQQRMAVWQAGENVRLEIARQQRLAACTAAADIVAINTRSLWGGIAAGLATGAACMN